MESTESRFAHLLQPIRELTKNWDIDVASELNDYLEELDEMCITFDGGEISLNFAQAALMIQGSACIYSKKVELLHNLVYQTLDYINDRNKKRQKQAAESQEGDDGRAASHRDEDDQGEFTSIELDVSEKSKKADSNTIVNVIPLPPESLIPPETHEKQKLPLISVKGEILCSLKDFRINNFIPGDQDMIILTLGSAASYFLLENNQRHAETLNELQRQEVAAAVETSPEAAAPADVVENGVEAADNFLPMEDDHMEQDVDEHVERHQAPRDGPMIRERQHLEDDKLKGKEVPRPPPVNVWALHDLYAVIQEEKPLKAGKCYKVPDGLEDGGKRKRKRVAPLQDFGSWFRETFDPAVHKLKNGPTFADLNYVNLNNMKNKLKTRKRILKRAGVLVSDEELKRTFLLREEAGPGEEPVEGFRDPDLLGGDDASDNEHDAFPDDVPAEFGGGADFIPPDDQGPELSYEDLVTLRVAQLVENCQGYTQETDLSRRVKEWEDKIKPVLELQEERPTFDIHDYGDRIVGALKSIGERRSFASIVCGLDNFEASKYLLASLQLANDRTVEVDSLAGLEECLDTMGLTLLSTDKATDRFKTLTTSNRDKQASNA
ncbi:condensin-2 complex subunit H2 [Halichoeres trimaculatus]|uniref:condensin-2 complex subunit H2 n=1 Tax=Halichoeres trimaculatus TaxID=147232 RepID=UPI003D9E003F